MLLLLSNSEMFCPLLQTGVPCLVVVNTRLCALIVFVVVVTIMHLKDGSYLSWVYLLFYVAVGIQRSSMRMKRTFVCSLINSSMFLHGLRIIIIQELALEHTNYIIYRYQEFWKQSLLVKTMIQVAYTCTIWSTKNKNMCKGVQILIILKIKTDLWIFQKCISEEVLFDLMTISVSN